MKLIVSNENEQEAAFIIINRMMELLKGAAGYSLSELLEPATVEEYIFMNELDSANVEIDENEKPLTERFEGLKKEWMGYWMD